MTERTQIEKEQIKKSLRILDILKVHYAIKCTDGSLFGPLSDELEFKKVSTRKPRRSFGFLDFNALVLDMGVGEVRVHDFSGLIPEGFTIYDIGGSLASKASSVWGNDCYKYKTIGNTIECIRTG